MNAQLRWFAFFFCCVALMYAGIPAGAATACDPKWSVGRCRVGMTLEQVRGVLHDFDLQSQKDGTRIVSGTVFDPMPSLSLGEGTLEVVFDEHGVATQVRFKKLTDLSEVVMLNALKTLWGSPASEGHYDGEDRYGRPWYALNTSWEDACGIGAWFNVKIEGEPARKTLFIGLERGQGAPTTTTK